MTIEQLVAKYHWLKIGDDGVLEMYLDNHALSTFRTCEAKFELEIMASVRSKGARYWSLDFGICWHKMVENYYRAKDNKTFNLDAWLASAIVLWADMKMEYYDEHRTCKTLGGLYGFIALCGQYAQYFSAEVDRLRVIGIEITFGKKKEVPIGGFTVQDYGKWVNAKSVYGGDNVRCYLTGRIDFLMDNGSAIGPLDHKTASDFQGKNKTNDYDPQDGMTGYVYAAQKIVASQFPELMTGRKVDRIWMNFAQIKPEADAMKRFQRVPIYKTTFQLEEYRLRQLRTFHKIYDMLVLGERPDWNTYACKMFMSDCQYKELHKQNSQANMLTVLNADFVEGNEWNPESIKD